VNFAAMPPLPSTNLILLPHVCSLSLKLCFRRLGEYFSFVFKPYGNIWKALRLHNYCKHPNHIFQIGQLVVVRHISFALVAVAQQ
jgi:hypothetical protein